MDARSLAALESSLLLFLAIGSAQAQPAPPSGGAFVWQPVASPVAYAAPQAYRAAWQPAPMLWTPHVQTVR